MSQWVTPDEQSLRREYAVEYVHHFAYDVGEWWPTVDDFLSAVDNAYTLEVSPELDRHVGNRSRTQTKDSLLRMIRGYRSYPEFRNEATVDNLYHRISTGLPMDMPILTEYADGSLRVFSGNTRMDVAFQLGENPVCLVIREPVNEL